MPCASRPDPQSWDAPQVRTDLVDSHMYIFDRAALMRLLALRPTFASIKQVWLSPPSSVLSNTFSVGIL